MLGVGLHSYGFMDKAFWSLSAFCGSQLLLMAVALAAAPVLEALQRAARGRAGQAGLAASPARAAAQR